MMTMAKCLLLLPGLLAGADLAGAAPYQRGVELNISCGEKVTTDNVLVLDLERFGEQSALATQYVKEQAGKYTLATNEPVVIQREVIGFKRQNEINRVRKEVARRGCDLLLVVKTGRNIRPNDSGIYGAGSSRTAVGYVTFLVGNRVRPDPIN